MLNGFPIKTIDGSKKIANVGRFTTSLPKTFLTLVKVINLFSHLFKNEIINYEAMITIKIATTRLSPHILSY